MVTKKEYNKGFTMIELIIAIAILSIGIIGIYGTLSGIISTTQSISSRFTAIYLAKEGMEIARNIRDDNFVQGNSWNQDIVNCSAGCQLDYKTRTSAQSSANELQEYDDDNFLMINTDGFYSYDEGNQTLYKRKITTTQEGSDTLKVVVEVFWNYNSQPFSFSTENYLYNWY